VSANGTAHDRARIVLRPVGSALPLGFFSFGVGMLLLAGQALEWVPLAQTPQIGMLLMAFVFPLELVATIFAFLGRDTMGATTLGLFTTSWLSLGWLLESGKPGALSSAIALYLVGFASAVVLLAGLAVGSKPFFTVLLLVSAVRMALDAAYQWGAGTGWAHAAGVTALVLTVLAFYGGLALGLEDAQQREILPLFRRKAAEEAFSGLDAQLQRLEAEAGVRQQL
jgi:succinate-acetate transporter protein